MPVLGIVASQISGHLFAPSGAYDSIATTTVGAGGTATITFSSIPATYTHLQVRGIMRNTNQNDFTLRGRFNSDTAGNYARHTLKGNGATASAVAETSQTYMTFDEMSPVSGNIANTFGVMVWDILDYANTNKYKTSRILGGFDANGSGRILFDSTLWQSTTAVSTISIFMAADNFAEYSQFALYGVKGA
jgi:hypothetical protein